LKKVGKELGKHIPFFTLVTYLGSGRGESTNCTLLLSCYTNWLHGAVELPKKKYRQKKHGDAQKKLAKSTKTKFEDPDKTSQEVPCSLSPSADDNNDQGNGESGIEEEEDTNTIYEPTSVIDGRRMMEDRMEKKMPIRTREHRRRQERSF
jgi:hypothetical protein